ncbi:MAG: AMP-binding protein [Ardenticatenaceae bacterium]|nr:AMP-binding protein [Ardenticatenaceae bacterium]
MEPVELAAASQPEALALVFMGEDGRSHTYTRAQFWQTAVTAAHALQKQKIGPDDLVILVMQHSQELLAAFWGAMIIGAIPSIFPFLTEKLDPHIYMERVHTLVAHAQARAVLTFPQFKTPLTQLLADVNCQVLGMDEVFEFSSAAPHPNPLPLEEGWGEGTSPHKIAFLQHSSGTTGLQKGVALPHRSVLNQIEGYSQAIALNTQDVIVSWLPLYHDMGLIAGFILPLVTGIPLVLMSPFDWVRDPKRLLWAIHEHQGTLCWLPNFAYNHMVKAIRQRDLAGLDLGHWRLAINCSEPVRHDSHQTFLARFAPFGFQESALATCYAMAENTFAVTQSERPLHHQYIHLPHLQTSQIAVQIPATEAQATAVVSCGRPITGTEIAIVGETGQHLPDNHVGEIILRGNAMLSGYYQRPDLTAQSVRDGWYYTGDMGYLSDGELYVTGRKKDLIITAGKNVYPQDLEAIANTIPGIYPGRAVAFGVMNERLGTESIVLVCELLATAESTTHHEIEQTLRRQIVAQTEVTLADVRFVPPRWLIKTSSGKLARSANRDKYLQTFHTN